MIIETHAQYHGNPAVSHSKLEVFRRRPALYHRKYVLKVVPDADSSAFAIGRATHAAVLEPQSYARCTLGGQTESTGGPRRARRRGSSSPRLTPARRSSMARTSR